MSKIKKELISACFDFVEQRKSGIRNAIADLEEALKLETKCSAGDKYETGRAMLHLEFEKLALQMQEYQRLEKTLSLIGGKHEIRKSGIWGRCKNRNCQLFYFHSCRKIRN